MRRSLVRTLNSQCPRCFSLVMLALAIVSVRSSVLQGAVVLTGSPYSENFDEPSLSKTAATGYWTGTTQAPVPGTSGWDGVRIGGTGSAMNYAVNDGSSNAGAIYSHGSTASTERALGSLASGANTGAVGVELVNNTGSPITQVSISYVGEFWRSSTTSQNVLTFGYEVGASGSTSYLSSGTASALAALDLVGPAPVQTNGALDGNLLANQANFSSSINLLLPVGQSLYLRWSDFNDIGNDAGLAIDNFQLTFSQVPEPSSLTLAATALAACGSALAVWRRRGR
jgi:trimeric autotransporter adhesin